MTTTLPGKAQHPHHLPPIINLRENWPGMSSEGRCDAFSNLTRGEAKDFFLSLKAHDQADLIQMLPEQERGLWLRVLPLDDLTDVLQELSQNDRKALFDHLDHQTLVEVKALMAYGKDQARGPHESPLC